jgi:hypothetical protein
LITGYAVPTPDNEIAEVAAGNEALLAEVEIFELNYFTIGNSEAPVVAFGLLEFARRGAGKLRHVAWITAAGSGIDWLVVLEVEFAERTGC